MAARAETTAMVAAVVSVPTTVAGGPTMEAAATAAATTTIETITAIGIIKTTTAGAVTNAGFFTL